MIISYLPRYVAFTTKLSTCRKDKLYLSNCDYMYFSLSILTAINQVDLG